MNLAICPMCDGPVKYMGTTIHDLEILPPLGRPKSTIVQVQMPYSMKLLTQEQEAYLNLTMRYVTTSGIQRLNPLKGPEETQERKVLQPISYPDAFVPAYVEVPDDPAHSEEELRNLQLQLGELSKQEREQLDVIHEVDEEKYAMEEAESTGIPLNMSSVPPEYAVSTISSGMPMATPMETPLATPMAAPMAAPMDQPMALCTPKPRNERGLVAM
jgi:hypothetical protein